MLLLAPLLSVACDKEAPSATSAETSAKTSSSSSAKSSSAEPAGPPAPTYPTTGKVAEKLEGLAPTPINPKPQSVGSAKLSSIPCLYDGPAFVRAQGSSVIGDIAWSTDGSLYVIDSAQKLRRYKVEGGDDVCHLRMDRSFGENGFYSTGDIIGTYLEGLSADAHGHVIASTGLRGSHRITGTKVDYHCKESKGNVAINPAGTTGSSFYASKGQKISYTDSGCTVEPWEPAAGNLATPDHDATEKIFEYSLVGDRVFVAAVSPTLAREVGMDGQPVGKAFGPKRGGFCSIGSIVGCAHGLCIFDYNCKELRVFKDKETPLGSVNLHTLVGLPSLAAPHGVTYVRKGVAYVTMTPGLGRGNGVYEGFIFRIRGL